MLRCYTGNCYIVTHAIVILLHRQCALLYANQMHYCASYVQVHLLVHVSALKYYWHIVHYTYTSSPNEIRSNDVYVMRVCHTFLVSLSDYDVCIDHNDSLQNAFAHRVTRTSTWPRKLQCALQLTNGGQHERLCYSCDLPPSRQSRLQCNLQINSGH